MELLVVGSLSYKEAFMWNNKRGFSFPQTREITSQNFDLYWNFSFNKPFPHTKSSLNKQAARIKHGAVLTVIISIHNNRTSSKILKGNSLNLYIHTYRADVFCKCVINKMPAVYTNIIEEYLITIQAWCASHHQDCYPNIGHHPKGLEQLPSLDFMLFTLLSSCSSCFILYSTGEEIPDQEQRHSPWLGFLSNRPRRHSFAETFSHCKWLRTP